MRSHWHHTNGMNERKFRWGILGTAQIAKKNWKAIRNTTNGIVAAVASRDLSRSRDFVAECQAEAGFETAPRAVAGYEALITADDIDGLYIPLPTGPRKEWVLRAAAAGKHVVCEKPCAVSVADLTEMLEACRRNQVQFMDGVMFMHSRRLGLIRQALADGQTIGRVRRITSTFSFSAPEQFFNSNIRVQTGLEPHGCLGDLGWYCIRFALWVMDEALPRRVTGRILSEHTSPLSPAPALTEFAGELFFDGGVSSGFYCSFITGLAQWADIIGTDGYVRVPDFVLPFSGSEAAFETASPLHKVQGCDFELEPRSRRWALPEHSHSHPTAQETMLFQDFADQVRSETLNPSWPGMALKTQQVLEACRASARAGGQLCEVGQ